MSLSTFNLRHSFSVFILGLEYTAWKVFLIHFSLLSDWIRENTDQKKVRIWTLFIVIFLLKMAAWFCLQGCSVKMKKLVLGSIKNITNYTEKFSDTLFSITFVSIYRLKFVKIQVLLKHIFRLDIRKYI